MSSKSRALEIQSITDRRDLHHDVVEGRYEIILPSKIGSARRPMSRDWKLIPSYYDMRKGEMRAA
jgi:hypothetical protein